MQARDAPKITTQMPVISPVISAPVSRLIPATKPATATGGRKTPKPKGKETKKPHQPSGYEWRREGAGWDLRKVVWIESATGGKQRKRPYLGHLSKTAFGELKRQNKGASLERAIAEWIAAHDKP